MKMASNKLQFYQAMYDINEGEKSYETICKENNYDNNDSYEFRLVLNTYTYLKKREHSGTLYKNEPALKTDKFSLREFIKQKIWWYTGPDAYFELKDKISDSNKHNISYIDIENTYKNNEYIIKNYERQIKEYEAESVELQLQIENLENEKERCQKIAAFKINCLCLLLVILSFIQVNYLS